MRYLAGVFTITGIYMLGALGVSILTGFTGMFSIGHAGFMAVGGYVSALLSQHGVPVAISVIVGMVAAVLVSAMIGIPSLRLTGDYFVIASLAFGEVTKLLIENLPFTGGARGLTEVPIATSFGLVVVLNVVVVGALRNFIHSRYGRAIIAIREEELAAECLGVTTLKYKTLSFMMSAALCGLAGALLGHYVGYLHPSMFNAAKSTDLMVAVVLGGQGSLSGTVLASLVLFPLPEVLRATAELRFVTYGLILVFTMLWRPQGLLGRREIRLCGLRTGSTDAE